MKIWWLLYYENSIMEEDYMNGLDEYKVIGMFGCGNEYMVESLMIPSKSLVFSAGVFGVTLSFAHKNSPTSNPINANAPMLLSPS